MSVPTNRPPWDDYFMQITFEVAKRSTCPRAAVGAVIVRDKRILTTGYNGSPAGLPHCTDVGCFSSLTEMAHACVLSNPPYRENKLPEVFGC